MEVLSNFRKRPRKSKNPCRARFGSTIVDVFVEKTVTFKKSSVNKRKTTAKSTEIVLPKRNSNVCRAEKNYREIQFEKWETKGKRMVRSARKGVFSSPSVDDHQHLVNQEPFLAKYSAGSSKSGLVEKNQRKRMKITHGRNPIPRINNFRDDQQQEGNQRQLPVKFKNYIGQEFGETGDPVLVMDKNLHNSDVKRNLQRLSIPVNQVIDHGFLTEEERRRFNISNKGEKINAILIGPSLSQSRMRFKKWYMNSEIYVLVSGWNKFVEKNGLKAGMRIQLWSFKKDDQLYFVLVRS